jgi:hypothetical protein
MATMEKKPTGLRKKLLPIFKCQPCGNLSMYPGGPFCTFSRPVRKISTNIYKEMPEWCPLEDVKGE